MCRLGAPVWPSAQRCAKRPFAIYGGAQETGRTPEPNFNHRMWEEIGVYEPAAATWKLDEENRAAWATSSHNAKLSKAGSRLRRERVSRDPNLVFVSYSIANQLVVGV